MGSPSGGGRFDFDDGGAYRGGWAEGKAHGHGVCSGPKGRGEYSGAWEAGFESSGVYTCDGGGGSYEGEFAEGRRQGFGVETRGRWLYRGEWTAGLKGRYGVRQSLVSAARYDGTWANGLQDGYGSEIYADGGTFQGQWLRGMRHGYGVRTSAPFGLATRHAAEGRGGFVLTAGPTARTATANSTLLKISHTKQLNVDGKGTTWSLRSTGSNLSSGSSDSNYSDQTGESGHTNGSFVSEDDVTDINVIETYMGEWKNDKRCGFGIAERSDGFKYEGEWYNNKRFGYGITTFKTGAREEGKYKNNVMVTSGKKKRVFFLHSTKFRRRMETAVGTARRSSQIALQKADIAISRTATARGKAEQASVAASHARNDSEMARIVARQFSPEFFQPGAEVCKPKYLDRKDSNESDQLQARDDNPHLRSRSLYIPSGGARDYPPYSNGDLDVYPPPEPAQPSLLDVFRNNPDRRPSVFLRRPSAVAHLRRPSTVVELKLTPHSFQTSQADYSLQEAGDDHLGHYYESPAGIKGRRSPGDPAVDAAPPLSHFYGPSAIPYSGMDTESPRRSTLPAVLPDGVPVNFTSEDDEEESPRFLDGIVRTGSLHGTQPRRPQGPVVNARKNSLPDIGQLENTQQGMSRETIARLSSQRREAIRRQEEEALRLRGNPLLYLISPDIKDWLSRQQLLLLVLFINISLAIIFFKLLS